MSQLLSGVISALSLLAALAAVIVAASPAHGSVLAGHVRSPEGEPVVGAMVSFRTGEPIHDATVFTDARGGFRSPPLPPDAPAVLRVRRIGWRDLRRSELRAPAAGSERTLSLVLERETDPAALAAQLPANRWFSLVLARIDDERQREELVRQCTYCHQQGNRHTRLRRDEEEWHKVLSLMARMGGILSEDLRQRVPALFNAAYAPESAVPALTAAMREPEFAPPPPPRVRRALVEEWELGHRASMQHDLVVHPDGRIYSVDMTQDRLYRLDPATGARASWDLPDVDLPLGGVFGGPSAPTPPNANARVGPHSLQVAPDGALWATLALGNRLARFDPESESWSLVRLEEGLYPHTLRFDGRGRIWFTLAVSNHVGMFDPASGAHRMVRLPARDLTQALTLRLMPLLLWLNRNLDLGAAAEGAGSEGMTLPVPYGIDVAPDGSVWFSQLNEHRIGRIDPDSFGVEMVETPFSAPRRLRFDSRGSLWIPGFSSGLVARFDPRTRAFRTWKLPVEPAGSETPYALAVDPGSDEVWICGTNSDTLLRFEPEPERFTVYPLPTRVTYTREIDFDAEGRVWTSNSNLPTWQIEGGFPRVLRLDPDYAPPAGPGKDDGSGAGEVARR